MGNNNASSAAHVNVDPLVQIVEYGYNAIRNGNEHVSQEQFERLFDCLTSSQSAVLWQNLFRQATVVDLNEYAESVRSLEAVRSDQGRLRFVLSLVERKETTDTEDDIPYITEFLQWCTSFENFGAVDVSAVIRTVLANFLPLDEGRTPSVDTFVRWCLRNCPELSHDMCTCITESLRCGHLLLPFNSKMKQLLEKSSITMTSMWLLSNSLPEVFKYNRLKEGGRLLDKFNLEKMSHLHLLFDSVEHGLSSSRLRSQVFDYDAPTLTFVEFREQSFCIALDSPYKEHWTAYGGPYTALYAMKPKFCRLLSGENLVYSNFTTKSGKRCIGVGRNSVQAPVIEIDDGLSTGSVFNLSQAVVRLEVWGCGGDAQGLLRKQAEIKEWEQKEAARQRDRKFKGEAWEDSPDRVIMSWGGVNATNSEMLEGDEKEDKK